MAFIRQLPYDLVVAAPEIKRVEDLRGKKVAVADRGSVTFFVARSILQGHGLEPDRDVTILNMGRPDVRYQALMMGTLQVVVANFDGTAFWSLRDFIRSPRRKLWQGVRRLSFSDAGVVG